MYRTECSSFIKMLIATFGKRTTLARKQVTRAAIINNNIYGPQEYSPHALYAKPNKSKAHLYSRMLSPVQQAGQLQHQESGHARSLEGKEKWLTELLNFLMRCSKEENGNYNLLWSRGC